MSYNFNCNKCGSFKVDGKPVRINEIYVWYCKNCYLDREVELADKRYSKKWRGRLK